MDRATPLTPEERAELDNWATATIRYGSIHAATQAETFTAKQVKRLLDQVEAQEKELTTLRTAIIRYGKAEAALHDPDADVPESMAEFDRADYALMELARSLGGDQ